MAQALFLFLFFSLLSTLLVSLVAGDSLPRPAPLTYHGGPLHTGPLNLAIIWYGPVDNCQKGTLTGFIESLNYNNRAIMEPQVSTWWHMVESYQSAAGVAGGVGTIPVKVATQMDDPSSSTAGKVLTMDFIKMLVAKVTQGKTGTVAVIVAASDVTVVGICTGKCSDHGLIGTQPYVVVSNTESECPGACAWPFVKSDDMPLGKELIPPNGNIGADAMVMSLASGLASFVTNPSNTGFQAPSDHRDVMAEAATACPGMFGSGPIPGKLMIDPKSGGSYNAHGANDRKFLLPALWNPKTSSCWTLL